MFTRLLKIPFRLLMSAVVLSFLFSASLETPGFASHSREIRFTAKWASGDKGTKSVYYIMDDGSSHKLGTVSHSDNGDFTFDATFDDSIRVYVRISDDAVYHEHLYINDKEVESGDVGNGGLTYEVNHDSTVLPSGRIISPIGGSTITQCPVLIQANIGVNSSGIDWVIYSAYYGEAWHQIATDNSTSGANGYSTRWDCSKVTDPQVTLRISAQDNYGNKVIGLGGDILVNMGTTATANKTSDTNSDTTPPDGWLTAPSAGATISQCPLTLRADVSDAGSGVAWIKFWANHDDFWQEITPVVTDAEGWTTNWDCSAVANQNVQLRVTAQDKAGNQAVDLGGIVYITLAKNPSLAPTSTALSVPAATSTVQPAAVPTSPQQVPPTVPVSSTPTSVPAVTPGAPRPIFSCPAAVMPLVVGFGFLAWKKRPSL